MKNKDKLEDLAIKFGRHFIMQSADELFDACRFLVSKDCSGISSGFVVLSGLLPGGSDKNKIAVASGFGCTCPDCLRAAINAIAIAFGASVQVTEIAPMPGKAGHEVH